MIQERKYYYSGIALFLILLCTACATVISPSGGSKDVLPPTVVNAVPANYSSGFKAAEIQITFDEYILLNDLQNNLIISPPLENKPEIRVKGKMVSIKLKEELIPNTTYTFNFGDAIRDLTENNPIPNYRYVLSTGAYVDSLIVTGSVNNAFDLTPEAGVLVMLYECTENELCDSMPYKTVPRYFTKTDKSGGFSITNIKYGQFKIFVLKDENRNFLYDLPNEKIAFLSDLINASDSMVYSLFLFEDVDTKQKLFKAWSGVAGRIDISFRHPAKNLRITPLNFSSKKTWEVVDYSRNRDTVYYWNTFGADTLKLLIVDDSLDFADTVKVGLLHDQRNPKLTITTNIGNPNAFDLGKEIMVEFSQPVIFQDFNKVTVGIKKDSLSFTNLPINIKFDDPALRRMAIKYEWTGDASCRLSIPKGSFKDMFGMENDSFELDFKTSPESYYGAARLDLVVPHIRHTYIFQLYNAAGFLVDERFITPKDRLSEGMKRMEYKYLAPGNYSIKVIYDLNNNKIWDTGNYMQRHEPEKVAFYPEQITVRSNWDLVLEWELRE